MGTCCSSMRASTTQTAADDVLPVRSQASNPSWVLLNGVCAQLDVASDRVTASAMSRTGEEISVSLELVEPPGISVLTVAGPRGQSTSSTTLRKSSGNILAAHRDVMLLAITIPFPLYSFFDLFVYQASHDPSRPSSLLLLPRCTKETGIFGSQKEGIGIMSCASNDDSPSFVVAQLRMATQGTGNVRVFRSRSGQWVCFKNLHVRGTKGVHDLRWWSADVVVPYGRRHMIWADYYRGMVIMELSWQSDSETTSSPPRLRYVPLPVRIGDLGYPEPEYNDGRRGRPKACRSVCVTRYGIKPICVDIKPVDWSHRFQVTTWSLREDNYSWKNDLTMHEEEFREAFYGGDRFPLPQVLPKYPIVDPDNPDVVVFQLDDFFQRDEPKWMIEVDLRKKVLLAATAYTRKESDGLSGDAEAINSARVSHYDPIQSELPR